MYVNLWIILVFILKNRFNNREEKHNSFPKDKPSYESSLIFIKSFLYLTGSMESDSPALIALIGFLFSLQSFLYSSNTFLLFFVKAKIKYLFPLFSIMYASTSLKLKQRET